MIGHLLITTIISVCLLTLADASVLDDLSKTYGNSTDWTYLSSQLLNITDTDSKLSPSTKEELSMALQLVPKLMNGAMITWSEDTQTVPVLIYNSFAVVNNLIDVASYSPLWYKLQEDSLGDCKSFLLNVDKFGQDISKMLKISDSALPVDLNLTNLEVIFTRLPFSQFNETLQFTDFNAATLKLSKDAIFSESGDIGITAISYKSFDSVLTTSAKFNSNQYLRSKMVSYSVAPVSNETFEEPVLIRIPVTDSYRNWMCGFISDSKNDSLWSVEGCNATEDENSVVQCSCDHLSTFGILGCVAPSLPWQVQTALVVSDLIIAGVFGVLVYVNKQFYSDIIVLVLCILATLFLDQLCILTGIFAVCNRSACKAMALIIHFFDLSIFFWVFGQSVQIALKISYVTMESGGIMQYCALGWITPAFIVASSVGLVQDDYENDKYCAVPKTSHAALGPIVCVVGCNYFCLVYLIYGYNNIRRTDNKAYAVIRDTKSSIVANGMISTLMFISWLLWTSAVDNQSTAYYWLWSISVLFLGFSVFLFYGVYNSEVQSELLGKFGLGRKATVQDGSVAGRAARSQHQLNEAIRLSQIIENSVVRDQDSVVGGGDCDQITNDSTISLTQTMTSTLAQRVGFRKARLGPSTTNSKSEGTTSNI